MNLSYIKIIYYGRRPAAGIILLLIYPLSEIRRGSLLKQEYMFEKWRVLTPQPKLSTLHIISTYTQYKLFDMAPALEFEISTGLDGWKLKDKIFKM